MCQPDKTICTNQRSQIYNNKVLQNVYSVILDDDTDIFF